MADGRMTRLSRTNPLLPSRNPADGSPGPDVATVTREPTAIQNDQPTAIGDRRRPHHRNHG